VLGTLGRAVARTGACGKAGKSHLRALDWFYRGAGATQLVGTLKAHRELPVSGILHTMVKRLCKG
jgi:hypothetical protein